MSNLYVIDTSSLIDLQENYPNTIFPNVWRNIELLVKSKRIFAPSEVRNEIHSFNKILHKWCTHNKTIFHYNTKITIEFVKEIMKISPKLVDPSKLTSAADPFVIALARSLKNNLTNDMPIIITQERNKPNKIPFVANSYNISSMDLLDFFNNENWRF